MQQIANPSPNRGNSQIIVVAFLLFALSGGILGFAVGALTHSRQNQQAQNPNLNTAKPKQTVVAKATQAPTATPTVTIEPLGSPVMNISGDGNAAIYTLQAINKTTGALIKNDSITCQLDLIKAADGASAPKFDVNQLNAPNPTNTLLNENVAGGLNFFNTPQVQPCKQGIGYWKVALSPTLEKGTYYIVGITNWAGIHYNWSYYRITVK